MKRSRRKLWENILFLNHWIFCRFNSIKRGQFFIASSDSKEWNLFVGFEWRATSACIVLAGEKENFKEAENAPEPTITRGQQRRGRLTRIQAESALISRQIAWRGLLQCGRRGHIICRVCFFYCVSVASISTFSLHFRVCPYCRQRNPGFVNGGFLKVN